MKPALLGPGDKDRISCPLPPIPYALPGPGLLLPGSTTTKNRHAKIANKYRLNRFRHAAHSICRLWSQGHSASSLESQSGILDHMGIADAKGRKQGNEHRGKFLNPEHPKHEPKADQAQGDPQVFCRPWGQPVLKGEEKGHDRIGREGP